MKNLRRSLKAPSKSFLLFGPRGTGKSTWLGASFKNAFKIDLLNTQTFLTLSRNPHHLSEMVAHLKTNSWVIIDEIQKIPSLLDEVHALYENKKLNFALTGSSARKLKRGGGNLLAGRALQINMFPMIYQEYAGQYPLLEAIEWGTLPLVISEQKYKKETLNTYVETYLKQELMEEGLVRKLEPFVRFLSIAGIFNAQILNTENIARESQVGRTTVDKYFQILNDTLIAYFLPAYQPQAKVKEMSRPKFYFFDAGVARAAAGLVFEDLDSVSKGFAFETFLLNEVRAYNHYSSTNKALYYYKISQSSEIDLIIELKKKTLSQKPEVICIEIKSSKKWDSRWCTPMTELAKSKKLHVKKMYGVYLGKEQLTIQGVSILPIETFLKELFAGNIF